MQFILTPGQMQFADKFAIETLGIPSAILMENAARSSSEIIKKNWDKSGILRPRVAVLCGSGNNGGDGFAIARHLHEDSEMSVFWIGEREKMSPETRINYESLIKHGIFCRHFHSEEEIDSADFAVDVLIDALMGVGGSEFPRGLALTLLQKIKKNPAFRIAIDVPTGLHAGSGAAHDDAFVADLTITMAAKKIGLLLGKGRELSGEIAVASIGIPQKNIEESAQNFVLDNGDIRKFLPKRKAATSKFDYGSIAVIASSRNMSGAGTLCANASISVGAGLVRLFTPRIHAALLPEIMPIECPQTETGELALSAFERIAPFLSKVNVIALGPGLGIHEETRLLSQKILENLSPEKTVILDADGLRVIEGGEWTISGEKKRWILTPHIGEFSRMTGINREEILRNPLEIAKEWAKKLDCIIHLKNVPSISTDGERTLLTINGNAGMASAGSGDVLTGIIAGLSTQGLEPLSATALGAFLHAKAGDYYAEHYSEETLTASKIIESLGNVL